MAQLTRRHLMGDATGFCFLQQPGPFDVGLRVVQLYE
jgi:hypothetical protein